MRHHLDLPKESKLTVLFFDNEPWATLRMWVSPGVAGSCSKDCSVGWGNHRSCALSVGSIPCDPQSGDWAGGGENGLLCPQKEMRATSGHTNAFRGSWDTLGKEFSLPSRTSLSLQLSSLQRSAGQPLLPQSSPQCTRQHGHTLCSHHH